MYLEEYPQSVDTIHAASDHLVLTRLSHSCDNPNWCFQYHLHHDEAELVYIDAGEGTYHINNGSYPLKAGTILIIERGALHSLVSDPQHAISCRTCAISVLSVQADAPRAISAQPAQADASRATLPGTSETFSSECRHEPADHSYTKLQLPPDVCPCMEAGEQKPLIHSLFLELERCRNDKTAATRAHCNRIAAALASIYFDLFRRFPKVEHPLEKGYVREVLLYMNEHYTSKITLESLAKEFFISANSISHAFAKAYGISPINYVIDRRMNDAKWMLINTSDSIPAISRQVGYDNPSHFCNLFAKRVGCEPRKFRETYGR